MIYLPQISFQIIWTNSWHTTCTSLSSCTCYISSAKHNNSLHYICRWLSYLVVSALRLLPCQWWSIPDGGSPAAPQRNLSVCHPGSLRPHCQMDCGSELPVPTGQMWGMAWSLRRTSLWGSAGQLHAPSGAYCREKENISQGHTVPTANLPNMQLYPYFTGNSSKLSRVRQPVVGSMSNNSKP